MKKGLLIGLVATMVLANGCGHKESENTTIITVDRVEDNGYMVVEIWDAETDECQYIDITDGSCIKVMEDGSIKCMTRDERITDIAENGWN